MAQRKEHIVMFPFMAQGHILRFLALAVTLEQKRNCMITFVNTPLNIKKLRSSIPANSSINLLEIPFSISDDHGLPPDTENANSLSGPHIPKFIVTASLSLKPAFRKLISDLIVNERQHGLPPHPPLCIVADMFFAWSVEVAHEFGIFHALFCAGGYGMACYHSLWLNLPHRNTSSDEFMLPDFPEATKIHVTQLSQHLRVSDGTDSFGMFAKKMLPLWLDSDGILFNTVEELDRIGLLYFRQKTGKPVWPIGPVQSHVGRKAATAGPPGGECIEWLDTRPVNSVLYVAFGSENTISKSQMMQLAIALEASGKNFIWVVRPPVGVDINSEFQTEEWLPKGFEERMRQEGKRGLLVHKWAPQVEILSHKSVSAFLSHCGWNSVLEALSNGVRMIGWPMAAEQFYNVKLLEEMIGVCVEVARGSKCEVRHEDIVEKIEWVMSEKGEGIEMKRKACEVRDMIKNAIRDEEFFQGSSLKAMDEFLSTALLMKEKDKRVANNKTKVHSYLPQ